jgi:hypothetical protein
MSGILYVFPAILLVAVVIAVIVAISGVTTTTLTLPSLFSLNTNVKEGMSAQPNKKEKEQMKKHLEFLNYLIVHSDPTPDGSGDYTSDTGVDMIQTYLKTLPANQRLHPMLAPYLELLRYTTETEENDKVMTDLKKLILDLSEKEEERLSAKQLAASAKKLTEGVEVEDGEDLEGGEDEVDGATDAVAA